MHTYLPIAALLFTTLLGVAGLALILLSKISTLQWIKWYKKRIIASAHAVQGRRTEPSFGKTALKDLHRISDSYPLLFEGNTFDPQLFSTLYLMAPPKQYYTGYVLWQALMTQKLSYGPMKIFHAYEGNNNNGRILFSVANALEPGYFESEHIDQLKTPGICLFMHYRLLLQPANTFESMLKVGKRLEHLLGGKLCDSQRQPLSEAAIHYYRHKLSVLSQQG